MKVVSVEWEHGVITVALMPAPAEWGRYRCDPSETLTEAPHMPEQEAYPALMTSLLSFLPMQERVAILQKTLIQAMESPS